MKLHQLGFRKVVALMGSTMSAAQEEMIRDNTSPGSRIILMFDEDEAGRAARDEIASRLAKSCYVRVHKFDNEEDQPEQLSADELQLITEGAV